MKRSEKSDGDDPRDHAEIGAGDSSKPGALPTQAMPKSDSGQGRNDGTNQPRGDGQSAGGAYPNPHTGKEERGARSDWQGGQSEIGYHGSGQLGDQVVTPGGNSNSATRKPPKTG